MSHKKLRQEKNCLNCGNTVEDRFCTHCGQENQEIQDSASHLIIHYIQDLFHYDGRFWHTLKNLLLKPGLVAKEYMDGKRRRNLEPIRFYVFASTVFFFMLFYMVGSEKWNITNPTSNYSKRLYNLEQEKEFVKGTSDTTYVNLLSKSLQHTIDSINKLGGDSLNTVSLDLISTSLKDTVYDGWLDKLIQERAEARRVEMEKKHEGDESSAATQFIDEVFHKLPQLLFLSMPFFAFFLKLLYFRSFRKNYVEHFIFSIYHYSYLFVTLTIYLVLNYGVEKSGSKILGEVFSYASMALTLYLFVYLLLAMKRFYNDRWRYLVFRYGILIFLFFVSLIVLFLLIIFLTYLL